MFVIQGQVAFQETRSTMVGNSRLTTVEFLKTCGRKAYSLISMGRKTRLSGIMQPMAVTRRLNSGTAFVVVTDLGTQDRLTTSLTRKCDEIKVSSNRDCWIFRVETGGINTSCWHQGPQQGMPTAFLAAETV